MANQSHTNFFIIIFSTTYFKIDGVGSFYIKNQDRLSTIKCKEIRYHQIENRVVDVELGSWVDLFRMGTSILI